MNDKTAAFLVAVLFYKVFPTILVRSCLEMVTNFYYGEKWRGGDPANGGTTAVRRGWCPHQPQ
jgi:hypothetical protein